MKYLKQQPGVGKDFPVTSLREITILLKLKHPNIVSVHEVVIGSSRRDVFMVMEFVDHDLKFLMEQMKFCWEQSEIKRLMMQLLDAVAYLHDNWIIHRDLKTSNILLNNMGQLKIADFGMGRKYAEPCGSMSPLVVTLNYRAPEITLGANSYGPAIDMWSVGCIFGELVLHTQVFDAYTEVELIHAMNSMLGPPNEQNWPGYKKLKYSHMIFPVVKTPKLDVKLNSTNLSSSGKSLLRALLTYDPDQRITARKSLKHAYFFDKPLAKPEQYMPTFKPTNDGDREQKRTRTEEIPHNQATRPSMGFKLKF